nr:MAG TPA: hypothetical protein [Crassvirales sp.]
MQVFGQIIWISERFIIYLHHSSKIIKSYIDIKIWQKQNLI